MKLPDFRKLLRFLRRSSYETPRIRFCARFDPQSRVLVLLPENPYDFGLALKTIISVLHYFKTVPRYVYEPRGRSYVPWLEAYRVHDLERWPPEHPEPVDVLVDFSRPPSPYREFPRQVQAEYRVSYDPESFPFYNLLVATNFQEAHPYEALCRIFQIPLETLPPVASSRLKGRMWNELVYRGHSPDRKLVFLDTQLQERDLDRIEAQLVRVTFLHTGKTSRGLDITRYPPLEQLALLALSDLYIGEDSLFLPMALDMGIPVLLRKTDRSFEESDRLRLWDNMDSLEETLQALFRR